jgi:hypothetical protein
MTITSAITAIRIGPADFWHARLSRSLRGHGINLSGKLRRHRRAPNEIRIHAGARMGSAIAILAFVHLHEGQTLDHRARYVKLDRENRVTSTS